jgi:hypothetical protein
VAHVCLGKGETFGHRDVAMRRCGDAATLSLPSRPWARARRRFGVLARLPLGGAAVSGSREPGLGTFVLHDAAEPLSDDNLEIVNHVVGVVLRGESRWAGAWISRGT